MHASLRGKMMKCKPFASLVGTVLYFACLGNALGVGGRRGPPPPELDRLCISYCCHCHCGCRPRKTSQKTCCKLSRPRAGKRFSACLTELEVKTSEARAEHARVQAKLASLEQDTRKIIDELIAEGEAEKQKIIEAAHRQAEYIQQQAEIAIQQEIQAARDSLKDEIAELSVAAAQDMIKKRIKADDQQRLVREFMTKVVEAK